MWAGCTCGIKDATDASMEHRSPATAMANGTSGLCLLLHLLLLSAALRSIQAAPTETVTQPPPPALEEPMVEGRAQKEDHEILADDDDLDGRSAYVNNQYVPNEPVELNDEQNAPLYEILQKQMEQVLAATGPDVPIYEDDKTKQRQREQQLPNKPLFTQPNNEADEADDDYVDETASELDQGYADAEKPDATIAEEQLPEPDGYQLPQISSSSSSSARPTDGTTSSTTAIPPSSPSSPSPTRSRPHRRRTTVTTSTTVLPRTTRGKHTSHGKPTVNSSTPGAVNQTEMTTAAPMNHKLRPQILADKPNPNPNFNANNLPHEPQIYQHKRRIIFKTISTGSQFVNSPIGDLMIKFSIGFAKPAQGVAAPTNEALRALSNNLLRNIELQKLKRFKLQ